MSAYRTHESAASETIVRPTLVQRDGQWFLHAGSVKIRLAGAMALSVLACGGETTNIDGGADAAIEAEAGDFGSCGPSAHDCLCACADGGDCTSCYQTYPTCVTCIDDAVTTCCPNEYPAYTKCLDDSQKATSDGGPAPCSASDTACQNAFCQSQAAALQTCLATQTCKTANAKCTGTCP